MRAGLVAVPVNFKFPRKMIEYVLADSDARMVFCDPARKEQVPDGLPFVLLNELENFKQPEKFQAIIPNPGETAMILYTSGSTGRPKGVGLSHQSHIWVAET